MQLSFSSSICVRAPSSGCKVNVLFDQQERKPFLVWSCFLKPELLYSINVGELLSFIFFIQFVWQRLHLVGEKSMTRKKTLEGSCFLKLELLCMHFTVTVGESNKTKVYSLWLAHNSNHVWTGWTQVGNTIKVFFFFQFLTPTCLYWPPWPHSQNPSNSVLMATPILHEVL